jgi:hypothetical protein
MWALRLLTVCKSVLLMFFGPEQATNSNAIKSDFEKYEYIVSCCGAKLLE